MAQADPLAQLRDIHLPTEPGWWPLAPGWWMLITLVTIATAVFGYRWYMHRRRQRPLKELAVLYQQQFSALQNRQINPEQFVNGTNELLKRHFVHSLANHAAVSASGQDWIELVQEHYPKVEIQPEAALALGQRRFQKEFTPNVRAVNSLMQSFLSHAKI